MNSALMRAGSLDAMVQDVARRDYVPKSSVHPGDYVIIKTANSIYSLCAQDDGSWLVSGGWFDKQGNSPWRVGINGCTWGGCVIKVDIVAALGLRVEFANRVTTSPIQKIIVIPKERQN